MTPVAGRLSDLYGKKKVLLTLLIIYIAGLTAGGFADSISFLLITRIIQGVGLWQSPAFSLLRDTFPPAKLALAYRGVWICIFCRFRSRLADRSQHYPELWMACNFLGYSSFLSLGNTNDCQIRKRKLRLGQSSAGAKASESISNEKRETFSIDIKGVLLFCYNNLISNCAYTYTDWCENRHHESLLHS